MWLPPAWAHPPQLLIQSACRHLLDMHFLFTCMQALLIMAFPHDMELAYRSMQPQLLPQRVN